MFDVAPPASGACKSFEGVWTSEGCKDDLSRDVQSRATFPLVNGAPFRYKHRSGGGRKSGTKVRWFNRRQGTGHHVDPLRATAAGRRVSMAGSEIAGAA